MTSWFRRHVGSFFRSKLIPSVISGLRVTELFLTASLTGGDLKQREADFESRIRFLPLDFHQCDGCQRRQW